MRKITKCLGSNNGRCSCFHLRSAAVEQGSWSERRCTLLANMTVAHGQWFIVLVCDSTYVHG